MSKKKNTLKDLDEFLKQQAATLVTPEKLQEKRDVIEERPAAVPSMKQVDSQDAQEAPSLSHILTGLQELSRTGGDAFNPKFYELIIKTLESKSSTSPEDKMLINTALYLKHGANWKEAIRTYWRQKAG